MNRNLPRNNATELTFPPCLAAFSLGVSHSRPSLHPSMLLWSGLTVGKDGLHEPEGGAFPTHICQTTSLISWEHSLFRGEGIAFPTRASYYVCGVQSQERIRPLWQRHLARHIRLFCAVNGGGVCLLRTSKTTTAWCDARARPDSLTIVGAGIPRSKHTSCTERRNPVSRAEGLSTGQLSRAQA